MAVDAAERTSPAPLEAPLRRLHRRLLRRRAVVALAAVSVGVGALRLLGPDGPALAPAAGILLGLAAALVALLQGLRRPGAAAFAEHLNRRCPELEESAQLLLADDRPLNGAQSLQRSRVLGALEGALERADAWLPRPWPRGAAWVLLCGLVLAVAAPGLQGLWPKTIPSASSKATPEAPASPARLTAVHTLVVPPAYTALSSFEGETLDIELPEGSTVRWRLEFGSPGDFALRLSDDERLPLVREGDAHVAELVVERTGLYHVVELESDGERPLPGIHTLTVTLDRPPNVRIVEPEGATLDIPLEGPARFVSRALAFDDYGLGELEIRASVAKGAGEGVKFRDEAFTFDDRMTDEGGEMFTREWRLPDLGMEPGDEVYFFVVATDNRQPEPNTSRSDTVIVRWLDEAEPAIAAEGFAIDLMPEYFKSQRQIIIETEQLITDRDSLDHAAFEAASRALGQAQSDLKQRYGQYLGDEFGEGDAFDYGPEPEETGEGDGHGDREPAGGHDHEEGAVAPAGVDTSGSAADLIARFAHDHGAAEIGPITSRNPVGMMKRSIGNMWQAELHLRLAEPAKALPYEYDALKYLNLARQAERVYTRRLGFEPPPVSEERRLEGELDDVLEYERRLDPPAPDGDEALFGALVTWLSRATPSTALDDTTRSMLARARDRLETLAQQRPALIRHAATIERIRVAGGVDVPDCDGCVKALRDASWSLLPPPAAAPVTGRRAYTTEDPLARDYADALENQP